jgi:glyoxalase superfamily protein
VSRVHAVLDLPHGVWGAGGRFWSAALGWPVGAPWPGHPELRSLEPVDGAAYVHLQQVDGPPRVHVDLETDDRAGLAEAVVAAGASAVACHERWDTFASPGGLPFCLVGTQEGEVPRPMTWAEGQRSRLVQVCIDAPAPLHDAEVSFWRTVLGGRWVDSPAAEFAGKWHDDHGSPLQLLFQRLEDEGGPVRAHLDLGTDGQPAELRRLLALGARDVGPGPGGWHVLQDPSGLSFCVTGNSPESGVHRDLG